MEEIFIQNQGFNKTFIYSPNNKNKREVDWDLNYNGKQANIDVKLNNNNYIQNYQLQLDNEDLEELFNIPSEPFSLDKRLKNDFLKNKNLILSLKRPKINKKNTLKKHFAPNKKIPSFTLNKKKKYTHLSSPVLSDNYLINDRNFINNKTFSKNKKFNSYSIYKDPKKYSRRTF